MKTPHLSTQNSIGIFDSGIGGLSVLRELQNINPGYPVVYFADQVHVPYGPRPIEQIKDFSFSISKLLINAGAKVVVVACNTASAAALHALREFIPEIKFVGMEPAVKPAAETTQSGVVGVLATPATFQGQLYNSVVSRFAKDVTILKNTCPGLVQEIEKGNFEGPETIKILQEAILPMLEKNIDTLVLGCTHYPFVIPAIKKITGNKIRIIDPAPAVAKQTIKQANQDQTHRNSTLDNNVTLITSGSINQIKLICNQFNIHYDTLFHAEWDDLKINLTQH